MGLFFSFFFRTFHKKILNATIKPRFCLLHFCKDDWTSISYYLLATYSSISDFVSHDSNNIVCLRDVICLVISNPSYFLSSVSISLNLKQWTLNPCKSPYCILWDFSFLFGLLKEHISDFHLILWSHLFSFFLMHSVHLGVIQDSIPSSRLFLFHFPQQTDYAVIPQITPYLWLNFQALTQITSFYFSGF